MVLPGLQGLLKGLKEPLGIGQIMASVPQPLDQLNLAADPLLTFGNVAVCLGEMFSFGGKIEHGGSEEGLQQLWAQDLSMRPCLPAGAPRMILRTNKPRTGLTLGNTEHVLRFLPCARLGVKD